MRKRKNERGAAVIEFAVVLPLLLLLLFSMIDFGRYFYTRITLSSATFEVADAIARGLLSAGDDDATKRNKIGGVVADIAPGIASFAQLDPSASLNLDPLPLACPNASTQTIARISTPFNSISPLTIFFTEASATTTMRCLR